MDKDQDLPEQDPNLSAENSPSDISAATTESAPPTKKKNGNSAKKKREPGDAPRELSSASQEALKTIEALPTVEEKIRQALEFMRAALSQSGNPRFKDFWDIRHFCLGLFKENIPAASRAHLWSSYVELSSEARRLKEILDEQTAFAAEQIELAITALENELSEYSERVAQMKPQAMLASSVTIKAKKDLYERMQGELDLLNTLASRINGLRKEVIKTDMRMKTKAKFFDKLSAAGDRIFPRRKELVKQISQQFLEDIRSFAETQFPQEISKHAQPLYLLREEIKVLQGIAKILTLNTQSFKETREMLSSCWDKIRECEKKKKEEFAHKRQASQQNADLVIEKIKAMSENAQKEGAAFVQIQVEAKEILDFMRTLDLDREAVFTLKAQVKQVLQPFLDQEKSAEDARLEKNRQEEQAKREKVSAVLHRLDELLSSLGSLEIAQVVESKRQLEAEFKELSFAKNEKMRFEKTLRKLADAIVDKKEKTLLHLSSHDREILQELKEVLKERLVSRHEIKKNLENYRKVLGGSGFDFEKAMMYREMLDSDKARLEKINESIAEIEEKITEIEDNG